MKINKIVCDSCGVEKTLEKEKTNPYPAGWRRLAISVYDRGGLYECSDSQIDMCPNCDFKREITVFKKDK